MLFEDKGVRRIQEMKRHRAKELRGRTQRLQRPYHVPGVEAGMQDKQVKAAQAGPSEGPQLSSRQRRKPR